MISSIVAEICSEADSSDTADISGVIELTNYIETISRTRDVIKMSANGVDFVIYGIENQGTIHYAMPLRTMTYDGRCST